MRRLHPLAGAALALVVGACASLPPTPVFTETAALREACPAERALYASPDGVAALRLVKTPHPVNAFSDLAIRVEARGHVFWFSFVQSMGFGRVFLGEIADPAIEDAPAPEGDGNNDDLVVLDADLRNLSIPQSGEPAPDYIIAPAIGARFWYDLIDRPSIAAGPWRRIGCAAP